MLEQFVICYKMSSKKQNTAVWRVAVETRGEIQWDTRKVSSYSVLLCPDFQFVVVSYLIINVWSHSDHL
jgi:hypothetical protein